MNRKGFTLVELLATVTILGLIVTIGGISISGIIKNAKQKEYDLLASNIKSALDSYYQECVYGRIDGRDYGYCKDHFPGVTYTVLTSTLIEHGYISPNSEDKLINPKNEKKAICSIKYKYNYDIYKLEIISIIEDDLDKC